MAKFSILPGIDLIKPGLQFLFLYIGLAALEGSTFKVIYIHNSGCCVSAVKRRPDFVVIFGINDSILFDFYQKFYIADFNECRPVCVL